MNFIDMENIQPQDIERWRRKFLWFVKALTVRHKQRQLVLKSPPHTGRVAELLHLFPNAKFIHMVRDPRKLYASTLRLWKSLIDIQGMQNLKDDAALKDYIWTCLNRMYDAFERARPSVPQDRIVDVKYEELIANPEGEVERVYNHLHLGDASKIKQKVAARFQNDKEYKVNEHKIDAQLEAEVLQKWQKYAERYGY